MEPKVENKLRLESINIDGIEKYGYTKEVLYNNSTFNGHMTGIAVAIIDNATGDIKSNFLSKSLGDEETRDALLKELLADKNICLDKEPITQFEDHELVERTVYYMPYAVASHSRNIPTIDNLNVSNVSNVYYKIVVEVLFVEDGLSRYLCIPFETKNVSIMDLVYEFFDDADMDELAKVGIKWQSGPSYDETGYVLDFYDYFGHKYDLVFNTSERMRDAIVSMRLINFMAYNVDEGDKNA